MIKIKKPKFVEGEIVLILKDNKYLKAKIEKIDKYYHVKLVDNEDIEKYGNSIIKIDKVIKYTNKQNINKNKIENKIIKTEIKNKKGDSIEWVSINDKRFPLWINKTFLKYKLKKGQEEIRSKEFKPFLYQLFLKEFMDESSPYRGILLFHGLGSGKTCSAITIAENLKSIRNVLTLLPASLKDNFITSGLKFCGKNKNDASINRYYTFISSNASNTLQQLNKLGSLDNHLIIIDEIHGLISRIVGGLNGENKQGVAIYKKIMDAKNVKIIGLTGTPIVNNIYELAIIANIMHGYSYVTIFKINNEYSSWKLLELENEYKNLSEIEYFDINVKRKIIEFGIKYKPYEDLYTDFLKKIVELSHKYGLDIEYIDYETYSLFPDEPDGKGFKEFEEIFVDKKDSKGDKLKNIEIFKRRLVGLISYYKSKEENFPRIKERKVKKIEMSHFQYLAYEHVREEEKKSYKLSEIRVFSRQISNFAFPNEISRPGIGKKKLIDEKLIKAAESDENLDEVKKDEFKKYQKEVDEALKKLSAKKEIYLKKDLERYSRKMATMLKDIENTKGLIFLYSDFRSLEGVEIMARVLDAHGYSKYDGKDGKHYALYTGSEDPIERKKMLSVFTNHDNKYGKFIKIILATSAGAEGLDLKNIRLVQIMEPYWNNVRLQQVIGRAVRRDSHIDLPENERNVTVYEYQSVIPEEYKKGLKPKDQVSTDEVISEIARRKDLIIQDGLKIMKEVSIDCVLNALDNNKDITCFTYGNSSGLAYYPKLKKDLLHGLETEMKNIKVSLKNGILSEHGYIYYIFNKKLYLAIDKLHRDPIKNIPKIIMKVAIDLDKMEVYDHDAAIRSKTKILIGKFNDNGQFFKV